MGTKTSLFNAQRILILGPPGAGKSTLADFLARRLSLPLVHLDRHFFGPGWSQPDPDVWQNKLAALLKEDAWVMEGQRNNLALRLSHAQVVIYLDLPIGLCFWRILKRRYMSYRVPRPSKREDCPEVITWPFLRYALTFNVKRLEMLTTLKNTCEEEQVYILKHPKEVRDFLATLA